MSSATPSASESAAGLVDQKNPAYKIIGICLAVGSGLFIGSSFVIKKKGLLASTKKYGNKAGEGVAYLKSWLWWTGMIMMIVGEILNFVAYAFTEAILVTPMGALSVVICAILSHFVLKESLTFFGWIGCTLCIIGSIILALNAPEEQSVSTIEGFKKLFLAPGFLVWASLLIVISLVLIFYVGPRWGRKTMAVYISVCSLIGGISVSCTQGLGASIVSSIAGRDAAQKNYFFWILFVIVVVTLLTEIVFLNKALELFKYVPLMYPSRTMLMISTSMVVPFYFCYFTAATMITSFILYQGLKASAVSLITMVLGFLVTCLGITLLQMSKVDPTTLNKLDRKSTILMQASRQPTEDTEKTEVTNMEEPGMDALRGGFGAVGSIIRARSMSRRMSNASSMRRGMYGNEDLNLSTHGLGHLQRYQLSDTPMPADAADKISLHSKSSGNLSVPMPKRSKSHLKFEESDMVHQYGYGSGDASHTVRPHPQPSMSRGHSGQIRTSSYPPVLNEEDEDAEREKGMPPISPADTDATHAHAQIHTAQAYVDPYRQQPLSQGGLSVLAGTGAAPVVASPLDLTDPGKEPLSASSSSGKHGLSGFFNFAHHSPDLTLHGSGSGSGGSAQGQGQGQGPLAGLGMGKRQYSKDGTEIRGGSHRGVRDYPHLSRADVDVERSERRALVENADDDDEGGFEDTPEGDGGDVGDWRAARTAPVPAKRQLPNLPPGARQQ